MRPAESFIGQPIRSLQTMLRVIGEDSGILPVIIPDGIYGQETMFAISAFQRYIGLPVTGVTDQQTWEAVVIAYEDAIINAGNAAVIEIIFDPGQIFRQGDQSPYIYLLQSILLYLSSQHDSISEPSHNGVLDDPTSRALAGFQALAGLEPTGKLDKKTWLYLVNQFTLNANLDR